MTPEQARDQATIYNMPFFGWPLHWVEAFEGKSYDGRDIGRELSDGERFLKGLSVALDLSIGALGGYLGQVGVTAIRTRIIRAIAERRLNAFVRGLVAAGKRPAAAVVAYDVRTGSMVAMTSGPVPQTVNAELAQLARCAGGLGVKTACGNTIGTCAEFRAANTLMSNGSRIGDIRFTNAIRPKTDAIIPPCANCESIFSKSFLSGK